MESIILEFLKQLYIAIKNYHFDTRESIKFETLFEIRNPLPRVLGDSDGCLRLSFSIFKHPNFKIGHYALLPLLSGRYCYGIFGDNNAYPVCGSEGSVEAEGINWALEELFRCPKVKAAGRSPVFLKYFKIQA